MTGNAIIRVTSPLCHIAPDYTIATVWFTIALVPPAPSVKRHSIVRVNVDEVAIVFLNVMRLASA